ncbi:hypothetical protein VNI00_015668 [Paramarasmius palmivorus]|uniref:WD40 repeat-like protein n=1 Tax=Paramarasmius palmivorus TaxID=297713 RepID=A0AAW0BK56_9AGAR
MKPTTPDQFFASWKFKLSHDFEVGGEPATFYPEHPKQWGSEDIHIQPPVNNDLLEEYPSTRSPPMAVSHDGTFLAVGVGSDIVIYDVPATTIHQTIRYAHAGNATSMCFRPRDNDILAVSSSFLNGQARGSATRIWDLKKERIQPRPFLDALELAVKTGSQAITSAVEWSGNSTLDSEMEKRIKPMLLAVQNELDIKEGRAYAGGSEADIFSHDGSYMLMTFVEDRNTVVVMDVPSANIRCRLVGHTDPVTWKGSNPTDTLIWTSSMDRTIRIWNAETGEHIRTLAGTQERSWACTFSPDGKLIAAGCEDRCARVWDVGSGNLIHAFDGFNDRIRSLAFSPDSQKLACGASGGTLRVFTLNTGDCLQHWQTEFEKRTAGHTGRLIQVTNVLYTCRGLLVYELNDGRVFTYDEKTNQKGQYEHGPRVTGTSGCGPFSVSRDGARLFASCFDGTIRVWAL